MEILEKNMNLYRISLLMVMFLSGMLFAQHIDNFELTTTTPSRNDLVSNSITDLFYIDGILYVATGRGLSISDDNGESWTNYTEKDYGGRGGVTALDVGPDGTLWIATGFDSTVSENTDLQTGGGIRYREPGSNEWHFIPQPVDARDDTAGGKKPTTTPVQNITFDLAAISANEVWLASFGGGIRRTLDRGNTWQTITTDGLPFDVLSHLNHRGFAVIEENGNIWVGTVGGISKTSDGGQTWQRFTSSNQNRPISGNWVIGIWHNPFDNSIWATTLTSEVGEFNAISRTKNGGASWDIFLKDELADGTFPRYVAFYDSAVYVATENGVYKSIDDGATWFLLPPIRDRVSGEGLYTSTFYSVATSPAMLPQHRLWVGSADGLASTDNSGYDWTIYRAFISTRERTNPKVYAYPNPYAPIHNDRPLRFQFDVAAPTVATIEIFNFAMEKVTTLVRDIDTVVPGTEDRSLIWDGKDNNGRLVDNGVYFFKAKIGSSITWGKIVIIN
jgi:hypothetical protein